eukprot:7402916-Alexandrium_andersonii.AAC.1
MQNSFLVREPTHSRAPWSLSALVAWPVLGLKSARCKVFGPRNPPLPRALLKLARSHATLDSELASRKWQSHKLRHLNARRDVAKQCTYAN